MHENKIYEIFYINKKNFVMSFEDEITSKSPHS